ncbi:atrial natriuretic peptide receptor 2-like [Heteronotia binoei]|uniref:atrial natriuretic peptide receptor 2-like n=1 Tax=Heteronotia binoei TaxID=13085 RepID=UPI002930D410|nr:atrial natriuretic peptide receptor 2-like [Heteronotia binoei]
MAAQLLLLGALLATLAVPSSSSSTARPIAAKASAARTEGVTVGVLLPERSLRFPWAWPRVQPALSLALEALEPQLRHQGLAVRTAFASTENQKGQCDSEEALTQARALKASHDPAVLLGLGCTGTSFLVSPLAQHWVLPLLRAGLHDGHKESSSRTTTVYAGPGGPALRAFVAQLHRHFGWTSGGALLLLAPDLNYWAPCFPLFGARADTLNFTVHVHESGEPDETRRFMQANGPVVYICGSPEMLQEIMHLVQAQNMTNGDYVFIHVDILGESLRAVGLREAAKPWQSKESQDAGGLREAFQTVLVITAHEPQTPEYRHFQRQLILRAQRDFGVAVNDSLGTLVAGCFHDVLLMYLRALSEKLREGGHKRNTIDILKKMRAQKFQGVTGTVSLDSNQDREMDFDLWALRGLESGEYQVVRHYIGPEKRIKWTGPIHWKKGGPPLDNPNCVVNRDDPSCDQVRVQTCDLAGNSSVLAAKAAASAKDEPPLSPDESPDAEQGPSGRQDTVPRGTADNRILSALCKLERQLQSSFHAVNLRLDALETRQNQVERELGCLRSAVNRMRAGEGEGTEGN